mmetsp:Transcript_4329/g.6485  ORF Transcript_4329/g.6485 Transcript_4329/m.6485 type:complete len:928 (+) Transcript_4329:131-2914(+)|eukprot:CAMPEP_0167756952 /NCGR_PEP_ID=MMETSP0110_2-20121227/9664_1 /TAXON_ID=629695 /ORGANISM="Gymnochlora sp., Strain CCMP2014" /LENGTH=927 /DNA_ID=CAMNT_0007643105 /DNA_START=67 /DNA_END=2850 /DNA_ORIENTATION=+
MQAPPVQNNGYYDQQYDNGGAYPTASQQVVDQGTDQRYVADQYDQQSQYMTQGGGAYYDGTSMAPAQQNQAYQPAMQNGGYQQQEPQPVFNQQTNQWEYPQQEQKQTQQPFQSSMEPAPSKPKKEERIDPSQIPRWSPESKTDQPIKKFYTRSGTPPPPSTHPFIAIDEGNCSPRYIRMSTNYVAQNSELIEQTKLCIGAIIQPLAEQVDGEEPPPVRDFGKEGPIRCPNCRAYINAFFKFVDMGKSFICNMCGTKSAVPEFYMCNLDSKGERRDKFQRPELCRGTIDVVAPADYVDNSDAVDPCYLFVVDCSYTSMVSGLLECSLESIRLSVQELSKNPNTRVGIITFDSNLYYYSVKKGSNEPRLDVIGDVDDAFIPVIPDSVLLPLTDEKATDVVYSILDLVSTVHKTGGQGMGADERAFGAAVQAAALMLEEKKGGKIVTVLSMLPDVGAGKLQARNDMKVYNTNKESSLLVPQGNFYAKLATFCAQARIAVDLFACPAGYVDLATIGALARNTGGQIYYYNGFHINKDGEAFTRDMYRNMSRFTAFGAVMVIRCSKGLKIQERYGNFFAREADEMEIPAIHCDSSFGIMLGHESKLETEEACIQTALLYIAQDGKRYIRIHTISLPVTPQLCNLFRHSDLDTIINLSLKQGVKQILYKVPPKSARKALTDACIDSLFVYRKYCSTQHSPGQLILPEPLKLLPLSTLGILKHNLFHAGEQVDERAFLTAFVEAMPTYVACSFVDPCLFSLTNLPEYACVESKDGRVFLPPVLKLSSDSIEKNGVYLLDNGRALFIWIGEEADQKILDQLFCLVQQTENGPTSLELLYDEKAKPESLNARVWTLITQLRKNCPSFKTISIVTRHTHTGASLDESQFFDHLIEDTARKDKWHSSDLGNSRKDSVCHMSYIDFLCHVHKKIQEKFY